MLFNSLNFKVFHCPILVRFLQSLIKEHHLGLIIKKPFINAKNIKVIKHRRIVVDIVNFIFKDWYQFLVGTILFE